MSRSRKDAKGGHTTERKQCWCWLCTHSNGKKARWLEREHRRILNELAPLREAGWFLLDDLERSLPDGN